MIRQGSTDEDRTGLLAPPDLEDGVESLEYWRRRRQQLPWYRIRARREAMRMMIRWEQRVGAAIVAQDGAPLQVRLSAGGLVVRTRLARWVHRAGIAVLATVTTVVVFMTVLFAAVIMIVLHAL